MMVTKKEWYFIGIIGVPYDASTALVIHILAKHSAWLYLLFLPCIYTYAWLSQKAYIAKVYPKIYGNFQYLLRSLLYQFIFIMVLATILYLIWYT
jgi:hypothetical protein